MPDPKNIRCAAISDPPKIDDRCLHYRAMGRRVVLDMPEGRGWT